MLIKIQFALVTTCLGGRFGIDCPSAFSKIARVIYSKNRPNQTCDYWLITSNQQTLCIKAIFKERAITNQ